MFRFTAGIDSEGEIVEAAVVTVDAQDTASAATLRDLAGNPVGITDSAVSCLRGVTGLGARCKIADGDNVRRLFPRARLAKCIGLIALSAINPLRFDQMHPTGSGGGWHFFNFRCETAEDAAVTLMTTYENEAEAYPPAAFHKRCDVHRAAVEAASQFVHETFVPDDAVLLSGLPSHLSQADFSRWMSDLVQIEPVCTLRLGNGYENICAVVQFAAGTKIPPPLDRLQHLRLHGCVVSVAPLGKHRKHSVVYGGGFVGGLAEFLCNGLGIPAGALAVTRHWKSASGQREAMLQVHGDGSLLKLLVSHGHVLQECRLRFAYKRGGTCVCLPSAPGSATDGAGMA